MNEIMPLLYSCLKLDMAVNEKSNELMSTITTLDSFLKYDADYELLNE
jgi:hypothetical protein